MRFAIAATDRYLGVFHTFLEAGWQPVKVFTTPTDGRVHRNQNLIDTAGKYGVDVQLARIDTADLADLARRGCEILVIASYVYRIVDWHSHLPYAINFHPAPLPAWRGPYPAVAGLLNGADHWAVTCHKISHEFDAGDILAAETFSLTAQDCHESLDLKTQLAARQLALRVAINFHSLWQKAQAQGDGAYVPHWSTAQRTLDFKRDVADSLRRMRAFGLIETIATVNDVPLFVRRAVGWTQAHLFQPGTLAHTDNKTLVVAVHDGFIALLEWSLIDPGTEVGRIGR